MTGTELIQFCGGGFVVGVVFGMIIRGAVAWVSKAINQ